MPGKRWTLTKVDWKRLESFQLRCQRRTLGIQWSDFITNAEVCIRSGLQSIQSMVLRCRLSLFGHVARTVWRPKQFCVWHATSETEFHLSQSGADRGVVLPSPGCTRFVQTVSCQLEMLTTVPRIGPCGERTLRFPRSCVDNDDDGPSKS